MKHKKYKQAIFCEHANEVPSRCVCGPHCYCKRMTCRNKPSCTIVAKVVVPVVTEDQEASTTDESLIERLIEDVKTPELMWSDYAESYEALRARLAQLRKVEAAAREVLAVFSDRAGGDVQALRAALSEVES